MMAAIQIFRPPVVLIEVLAANCSHEVMWSGDFSTLEKLRKFTYPQARPNRTAITFQLKVRKQYVRGLPGWDVEELMSQQVRWRYRYFTRRFPNIPRRRIAELNRLAFCN
jgi:hypothetical protein